MRRVNGGSEGIVGGVRGTLRLADESQGRSLSGLAQRSGRGEQKGVELMLRQLWELLTGQALRTERARLLKTLAEEDLKKGDHDGIARLSILMRRYDRRRAVRPQNRRTRQ
jgi:hypothetical protein